MRIGPASPSPSNAYSTTSSSSAAAAASSAIGRAARAARAESGPKQRSAFFSRQVSSKCALGGAGRGGVPLPRTHAAGGVGVCRRVAPACHAGTRRARRAASLAFAVCARAARAPRSARRGCGAPLARRIRRGVACLMPPVPPGGAAGSGAFAAASVAFLAIVAFRLSSTSERAAGDTKSIPWWRSS